MIRPPPPCHCYENRLRQTCCRGNPCGCPFPAPTHFHRRGCRRQSPWRIPLKIACVPPPSVIPTKIGPDHRIRGAGFKPAPQYQRHPHTVIPAESLPRTPIRGRNPVPGHLPCEDGQADPFSSSRVSATIAMADSSENSLCATTIRHSYENRPRPTVFVGAGFKPASQYQRHPHTVIPAESLPRTPIRGRNPVPGHLPCEDGQADPFSSSRVSVATGMANCYENNHRAAPTPSFLRK